MPDQKDKGGGGIPWPALLTLAVAGTAAIYYSNLKSERPGAQFTGSPPALGDQRYAERSWQDPFKPAEAWVAGEGKAGSESIWQKSVWLKMPDTPFHGLKDQIYNNNPGHTLVLAVMLPAGPSAELAEQRLRARVGVIEALVRCGYESIDSDHIGLQPMLWGKDREPTEGGRLDDDATSVFLEADSLSEKEYRPFPIPFEWFQRTHIPISTDLCQKPAVQNVLVTWLPEELMTDRPIARLTDCLDAIGALPRIVQGQVQSPPQVCVIGPRVSPTLRNMVKEALTYAAPGKRGTIRRTLSGVRILSPTALTAGDRLLDFDRKGVDNKNWDDWKANVDPRWKKNIDGLIAESIDNCCGAKFIRTTTTEEDFSREAWDELKLRHLPGRDCDAHIALVAEADTFYGRAVTSTFIQAGPPGVDKQVELFTYVRGIDGQAVDPDTGATAEPKNSEGARTPAAMGTKSNGPAELPSGTNQSDYLRRLADRIAERDAELRRDNVNGGIVAVGVLGTDVYDKMLILQALRDRLSSPLFFTTGVDAQYALTSEWSAAHNLICISPFGFSLDCRHQGPFPPFRDSNQTAIYASTLLSIYPDLSATKDLLGRPRRFEVGRKGLVDLSIPAADPKSWHPPRSDFPVTSIARQGVLWTMAAVLAAVLGLAVACGVKPLDSRRWRIMPWLAFAGAAVTAFVLTFVLLPFTDAAGGEPFAWMNGLSIWPTEIIRILTTGIAILFIWRSITESADNERQIEAQFRLCTLANAPYAAGIRLSRAEWIMRWPRATAVRRIKGFVPRPFRDSYAAGKKFSKPVTIPAKIHQNHPDVDASAYMPLHEYGMGWSFALKYWRVLGRIAPVVGSGSQAEQPGLPGNASESRVQAGAAAEHPKPLDEGNASHFLGTVGGEGESDVRVYAQNLWWEYLRRANVGIRAVRVLAFALLYLAFFGLLIFEFTGIPTTPARGNYAFYVDYWVLGFSVLSSTLLTWLVLDSTYLSRRFIQCLARTDTHWPAETIAAFRLGCDEQVMSEYLDIRLIAARTRVVGELIYYPFVIFFLLVIARTSLFANWTWPVGLMIVMACNLGLAIAAALMLRMTAEDARKVALAKIERRRIQMISEKKPDVAKILEEFAAAILAERDGAFSILSRHPMLAAVLLPSGSVGAWAILEYIARSAG